MISIVPPRRTSASYVCDRASKHYYLLLRHPNLALRDFAIAEAAAEAGFDCDSWPKLETLINAVRNIKCPPYPDYWPKTTTYQERYHAELQRAHKGVAQSYKDVDFAHQATTVPPFVVPAKQIIEEISNKTYSSDRVISQNGKRGHEYLIGHSQDCHKRVKIERLFRPQEFSIAGTSNYIDLTKDEQVKTQLGQTSISRHALGDISINIPHVGISKKSAKKQHKRQTQEQSYRHVPVVAENRVDNNAKQQTTNAILATTASRLKNIAAAVDFDREVLRQRWEIDDGLKDQDVTDDLAELNACFTRAEEAVADSLSIIEERLLLRRR